MIEISFLDSKEDSVAEHRLSVSKAKTFDQCKAKFKFSYIEKLPKKEWHFHLFGTFLHDVLETFHQELIDNAKASNISDDQNGDAEQEKLWPSIMKACFSASVQKFSPKLTQEQKSEAFIIIQKYLDIMREQNSNGILPQVIEVEKDFFIDINGTVLLNGFIDRIQKDHDGVLHVQDYKTTKDKKYLKDFFQLETYAYVLFLAYPDLDKMRASFMCLKHDCSLITKEYKRNDVEYIGAQYLEYTDNIQQEKLWRPQPQFLCKYCDFVEHCPQGENFLIKRGMLEKPKMTFGLSKW